MPVQTELQDGIYTLILDRPPTNALDPEMILALEGAVEAFLADPAGRVAIVASANRAIFSSGADLGVFAGMQAVEEITAYIRRGQALYRRIAESEKPFIAAINGLALGGGLELALACQVRVAYEHAKLGLPEITYGIIPGWGGTQRLPGLVGPARALEMILSGETIGAEEALRMGLVNRIAARSEVMNAARELARKIAGQDARAVRAALAAVRAAPNGLAEEARQMIALVEEDEVREGIRRKLTAVSDQLSARKKME